MNCCCTSSFLHEVHCFHCVSWDWGCTVFSTMEISFGRTNLVNHSMSKPNAGVLEDVFDGTHTFHRGSYQIATLLAIMKGKMLSDVVDDGGTDDDGIRGIGDSFCVVG